MRRSKAKNKEIEVVEVLFRMAYNSYIKRDECIAFFPEAPVNIGNILCYAQNEGHGEASLGYYQQKTKKANPNEYLALYRHLQEVVYSDCKLVVKQRLNMDKLRESWYKR